MNDRRNCLTAENTLANKADLPPCQFFISRQFSRKKRGLLSTQRYDGSLKMNPLKTPPFRFSRWHRGTRNFFVTL